MNVQQTGTSFLRVVKLFPPFLGLNNKTIFFYNKSRDFVVFSVVHVARSLVFYGVLCRCLFFLPFLSLYCLSYDLRLLITPLISSIFSFRRTRSFQIKKTCTYRAKLALVPELFMVFWRDPAFVVPAFPDKGITNVTCWTFLLRIVSQTCTVFHVFIFRGGSIFLTNVYLIVCHVLLISKNIMLFSNKFSRSKIDFRFFPVTPLGICCHRLSISK